MKWLKAPISSQNLYLKLAIFITGLVTGLESSLRQLISQLGLFLVFLLLEPSLYRSLLKALRRILPFLAGYWVFVTLFSQNFPDSVFFSLQILYLLLISVYVFANLSFSLVAGDSVWLRRFSPVNAAFFYLIATYLYLKAFFSSFHAVQGESDTGSLTDQISTVMHRVAEQTETIRTKVRSILSPELVSSPKRSSANLYGWLFLALLVLIHSL